MEEPVIAAKQPAVLELEPGTYYWCRCGPLEEATILRRISQEPASRPWGLRRSKRKPWPCVRVSIRRILRFVMARTSRCNRVGTYRL